MCCILPVWYFYLQLLNFSSLVGDDLVAMAANLDKLIAKPPPSKNLTFRISAGISKEDTPDEKALLGAHWNDKTHYNDHISLSGFAQLSIADWQRDDIPAESQDVISRTTHLHMWSLLDS